MKRNRLMTSASLMSVVALQACITIDQDGAETYVTVENSIGDDDCCEDDCCEDEGDCCDAGCDEEEEEEVDTGDEPIEDTGDYDTGEPDHEVSVEEEDDGSITVVLPFEEEAEFTVGVETEVQKLDVAFLLDTTSSMTEEAAAMAAEFSGIVDDIAATIEDAAYGFATFDDYAYGAMGHIGYGDKPFALRHQITGSESAVQSKLNDIEIHHGADSTESGMEALYQGLLGIGYDQDGDASYDTETDVLPFIASSSDAFNGTAGESRDASITDGGTLGGYGFREGTLPVVIYATDAILRDPEAGASAPGGSPIDAGFSDVVSATATMGARLIGVATQSSAPIAQMEQLATATGSLFEADGDGQIDDPLVFSWSTTDTSSDFRDTIVSAIQDMIGSVTFSEISVEVVGDDYGFVVSTDPESYTDVTVGSGGLDLDFDVTVEGTLPSSTEDQVFEITLNIMGDGTTLLGTQILTIVVPGTD